MHCIKDIQRKSASKTQFYFKTKSSKISFKTLHSKGLKLKTRTLVSHNKNFT